MTSLLPVLIVVIPLADTSPRAPGPSGTSTYDSAGRLVRAERAKVSPGAPTLHRFEYDPQGRLIKESHR